MEESSQKIFLRVPESLKEEWKLFCDAIGQNQNRAGTSLVEWILRLPTRDAQLLVLKISDPSREERERILREILKVDTFSPAPSNRLPEKPKPKIPRKRVNHDGTLS